MRGTSRARQRLLDLAIVWLWLVVFGRAADAVVPVIVGPLQALLAILPSLLLALGGALLAVFRPSGVKKLVRFLWHQKVFSCLLIGVVAGTIVLSKHGLGRGGPAAAEARAGTDWTLFRGDPSRSGAAAADAPDPSLGDLLWNFSSDARTIYSSPAVVGNRLYVTTADKGVFSDRGAVLCLDAESGAEVWRYSPKDFRATFSSPAITEGYIVCGEGLHYTTDARINCLDPDGKLLWQLRTKSHVESSPCIVDGRVVIGAGDDGYYCIDLKPGPGGQPNVVWHLAGDRYKDCESSPAAADGVVYFGLGCDGNALCAVEVRSGRELWRLDTPYPVFSPPTLAGGKLYIGMGNGNFIETAEQMRAGILNKMRDAGRPEAEIAEAEKRLGPAGEVWCVDLKTHKVDWKFAVPRTVLGAVAAGGGRLYFGSRDGWFYCISTDGKPLGKWNARSPVMTSPALGREHVYFATVAGRLHCLRADSLEPVWDAPLGEGDNFLSSPALALGHLYIGTAQDGLRCIGRAGQPAVPLWADGARGGADRSPFVGRVALLWRFPKETSPGFAVTAPLVPLGEAIAVPCTHDGKALVLKLALGKGLEDEKRVLWAAGFARPVTVAPGRAGERLFVVDGAAGEAGRALHCLGAADGREAWKLPIGPKAAGQFTLDRNRLFLWTGEDELACLPVGGEGAPAPLWQVRLGAGSLAPAPPADGILVVATGSALLALDDQSGTTLWRVPLEEAPAFSPMRLGMAVVVPTVGGIRAHSILDGSRLWAAALGRLAAPPAAARAGIAAVTEAGELVVLNPVAGTEVARFKDAAGGVPPLALGEDIVFAGKDLMSLRGTAEPPAQWARTAWLGEARSPIVWHDSHAYYATDKRGVVCLGPIRR